MATFTMTLAELMNEDLEGDVSVIGLDKYPIFDESYRHNLNTKILNEYWLREIGFESDTLFRHYMKNRMNIIMPVMNDMYRSTQLEFDPLMTIHMESLDTSKTHAQQNTTGQGESNSESTSNAKARAVNSDTPQTRLRGDADYASSMSDSVSDTTGGNTSSESQSQNSDSEATSDSQSVTRGRSMPVGAVLDDYRRSLINVDAMVIDQLSDLFMNITENYDAFTMPRFLPFGRYYYGI